MKINETRKRSLLKAVSFRKHCPKCDKEKPIGEFHKDSSTRSGVRSWCRECCATAQRERKAWATDSHHKWRREYYKQHSSEHAAYLRRWRVELKETVLNYYGGGKCACVQCGESRMACLSLDHIDGGGKREFKAINYGSGGANFYSYLRRIGYPSGYQTLCMNCQWVKRFINIEYGNWGNKNEG